MPFKISRSPYWQIEKRLAGYGFTGRLSSGVKDRGIAVRMETLLHDIAAKALADPAWYPLLDAVCKHPRTINLPDLLRASSSGRLIALRRQLTDPLIPDAVAAFEAANTTDRQIAAGLRYLVSNAGSLRLGDITARKINELCAAYEASGLLRNSVHRQLWQGISKLLRFHLGGAARDAIFQDVRYSTNDDTREVYLSADDIARLMDACEVLGYHELGVIIRLALLTSADRGVLLSGRAHGGRHSRGLLRRDVSIFGSEERMHGTVYLSDSKTETRSRTVPIPDAMCRELLALGAGLGPDDPMFRTQYFEMDAPWQRVRKAASLERVRFKDLRAQTAIHIEESGIPATVAQRTLGHSSPAMTRRYLRRAVTMTAEQAEQLSASMFGVRRVG